MDKSNNWNVAWNLYKNIKMKTQILPITQRNKLSAKQKQSYRTFQYFFGFYSQREDKGFFAKQIFFHILLSDTHSQAQKKISHGDVSLSKFSPLFNSVLDIHSPQDVPNRKIGKLDSNIVQPLLTSSPVDII